MSQSEHNRDVRAEQTRALNEIIELVRNSSKQTPESLLVSIHGIAASAVAEPALRTEKANSPLNGYLAEDFPYGICHLDERLEVKESNGHFVRMFGISKGNDSLNFQQLFSRPSSVAEVLRRLKADKDTSVKAMKARGLRRDKTRFPCQLRIHLLNDSHHFTGYVVMVQDMSEQVENKEKLSLANQMIHDVIEAMPARIFWKDSQSNYIGCNQQFARDFGYTTVEEFYQNQLSVIKGFDDTEHFRQIERAILRDQLSFHTQERKLTLPNGDSIWILEFLYPLKDAKGVTYGLIGNYEDISHVKRTEAEKLRLEDSLQQAQKMESLGRLVGGVAHDFNNYLTVILGYTQLLSFKSTDADNNYLKRIESASTNAKELVEKLLMFSRKQPASLKRIDITDTLRSSFDTFSSLVEEDIDVNMEIKSQPLFVNADKSQLDQVLLNLIVNACDAMNAKSYDGSSKKLTVTIDVNRAYQSKRCVSGAYACISVCDNGVGMDENTLNHLFDPFFSTKKEMGTGLGLATVFGIVTQNDGEINVESRLGQGSTFRIYWPLDVRNPAEIMTPEQGLIQLLPMVEQSGLVCVVEDDTNVRNLTSSILSNQGFEVLSCDNLRALKTLMADRQTTPLLLLTDVILEGQETGKDVADWFSTIYPSSKIMFMSGYDNDVITQRGLLDEGTEYLKKPFDMTTFISKVVSVVKEHHNRKL